MHKTRETTQLQSVHWGAHLPRGPEGSPGKERAWKHSCTGAGGGTRLAEGAENCGTRVPPPGRKLHLEISTEGPSGPKLRGWGATKAPPEYWTALGEGQPPQPICGEGWGLSNQQ